MNELNRYLKKMYSNSQMFDFITHTWNPIIGKCYMSCKFCYVSGYGTNPGKRKIVSDAFKVDLGTNKFIFVGSGIDLFAPDITDKQINRIIDYCNMFPKNKYLFHTKNPNRYKYFGFKDNMILGVSLESNRHYENILINAPSPKKRVRGFTSGFQSLFKAKTTQPKEKRLVTIEPILDFDLKELTEMVIKINPMRVYVGADSKGHNLPEPSYDKVILLKNKLKEQGISVHLKANINRLKKQQIMIEL